MTATNTSVRTTHGKWLMVAAVGNLEISKEIKSEFCVGRVTLITPAELRRNAKRFGIRKEHWQQKGSITRLLDGHQAIAVLHQTGIPDRFEEAALKRIRGGIVHFVSVATFCEKPVAHSRHRPALAKVSVASTRTCF